MSLPGRPGRLYKQEAEGMNAQEAKERGRQIIGKGMFPAFATIDEKGCPQIRSMMPVAVDEDLTIYYCTHRQTGKCRQIAANPKVSTLWSDVVSPMTDWRTVLVKGEAKVSDDKVLRDRFWMEELRFLFPAGADDPNFVILVVKPTEMILADNATMPPVVVGL
jgi:general stress protein 26